jgi:hypothetical protein
VNGRRLARALGWFSIGLGVTELVAPRLLARFLGVKGTGLMRVSGLRELASGIGILTHAWSAPWVWSRVAGDLMDLASLGGALKRSPKKAHVGIALGSVVATTALDVLCARWLAARTVSAEFIVLRQDRLPRSEPKEAEHREPGIRQCVL